MTIKGKKIVVTGGNGFLGKLVVSKLRELQPKKIYIPDSNKDDLRIYKNCIRVTKGADLVIHLAAKVGGIGYNMTHPAELFDDNLLLGFNTLRASRENRVKKFVGIGTICSYPKFTPVPFKEENLWNGYPEETNAPYGLAKKMLLVQSQAYRKQYNFDAIHLLPVNLYGPGDNFNPENSHVVPALIKKFLDARNNNEKEVVVWGTGKATREFLYIEDAAEAIIEATIKYNSEEPINIGSAMEISIADLSKIIAKLTKFKGKIVFDKTKPDGQPRRKLDILKAEREFGFKSQTDFKAGLKKTISWYEKSLKNNRS